MKSSIFIILLTVFAIQLSGQKKFSVGFELSMGISEATGTRFGLPKNEGFQIGRNAFLRGGCRIRKNMDLTLGLGYLVAREHELSFFGIPNADVDFTEFFRSHQYIVIPAGMQYHFGSFYLNPEFGIAFSTEHLVSQFDYMLRDNGLSISGTEGQSPDFLYRKVSLPIFLNFGSEIDVKSVKIVIGVKGYYSLNTLSEFFFPSDHYYGVGIVTGVKF